MSEFYGRKTEVIAGTKKFSSDDFSIYFSVPFDNGAEANVGEVEIYNLRQSTINGIKKDSEIIINAGYKNDIGAILIGVAKNIETDNSGVDHKTKIHILDGSEKWFDTEYSKTYNRNSTGKQILNDLLAKTGLKVVSLRLSVNKSYQGGKTVKGKLASLIAEIAKDCNSKVHVSKGKIVIRPNGEGDLTNVIISAEYGLINSPSPIEKEEKYSVIEKVKTQVKENGKTVTKYENKKVEKTRIKKGWKVKTLLNNRITSDSIITIKSKTANGRFIVENGIHKGNANDFITEFECFPFTLEV